MQAGGLCPQVGACCTCRQGVYAPRLEHVVHAGRGLWVYAPKSVHVLHAGRGCMPPSWSMLYMQAGGVWPQVGACCTCRQGMYAPKSVHVIHAGRRGTPPSCSMLYMQTGDVCPQVSACCTCRQEVYAPGFGACCTCRQGVYAPRLEQVVHAGRGCMPPGWSMFYMQAGEVCP